MSTQQIVPMYDDPIVPQGISVSFTPEACLTYQHPAVVARIAKELSCSSKMAESIFDDAKRFLFMCATQKGSFAPPPLVDEGWHAFVLFTRDYREFCMRYFGRFLDHVPFTDEVRPQKGRDGLMPMQRTLQKAQELYGELSDNWKPAEANCGGCDNGCNVACVHGRDAPVMQASGRCEEGGCHVVSVCTCGGDGGC